MPPKHHHRHHKHHHRHGPLHPHRDPQLDALNTLIDEGVISRGKDGFDQLLTEAKKIDPSGAIEKFLSNECVGLSPRIALLQLEANRAAHADREGTELNAWLRTAESRVVAIIPPFPPHGTDWLDDEWTVKILSIDHHHVPHHLLDEFEAEIFRKPFECRSQLRTADLIMFDAYRNGDAFARQGVVDLVGDPHAFKAEARFCVHFRPHPDDEDDVPLPDWILTKLTEI
ncbi:MAG: hypothetical protein HY243_13065 [Proteobacteria bacterium]|nr:hypothetical protein [Pseudomonadota bacterium]